MANEKSQVKVILGLAVETARAAKGAKHLKTEAKAALVGGQIVQTKPKKAEAGRAGRHQNHLVIEQREAKRGHRKVMDWGLGLSRQWTVNKFSGTVSSFWSSI
jgi:hypothetical protein